MKVFLIAETPLCPYDFALRSKELPLARSRTPFQVAFETSRASKADVHCYDIFRNRFVLYRFGDVCPEQNKELLEFLKCWFVGF